MGGRVAEELVFGEISTGAQNDLEQATQIARAMVVEFGMSPRVGPLSFGHNGSRQTWFGERQDFSENTAMVIDEEVLRLLNEAHEVARGILENDRKNLDELSEVLIEREVIDGAQLRRYLSGEDLIPSKAQLKQETEDRKAEEAEQKRITGPSLISSGVAEDGAGALQLPAPPV
jgi:cell division protease FtsH